MFGFRCGLFVVFALFHGDGSGKQGLGARWMRLSSHGLRGEGQRGKLGSPPSGLPHRPRGEEVLPDQESPIDPSSG